MYYLIVPDTYVCTTRLTTIIRQPRILHQKWVVFKSDFYFFFTQQLNLGIKLTFKFGIEVMLKISPKNLSFSRSCIKSSYNIELLGGGEL